ncbi:MAG: hypothetical protein V4595_06750 [Pseudomonadota bacterium]
MSRRRPGAGGNFNCGTATGFALSVRSTPPHDRVVELRLRTESSIACRDDEWSGKT